MSGFNPFIAVLTSSLWFAAVFLGATWIGPAWDSFVQRHIADITPRLRALGMDGAGIHRWMRLWGIIMFSVFVTFAIIKPMIPVAVGLTYVVFIAPRYLLDHCIKKRNLQLRDQLVRAAVGLANASRAGLALAQGLETVAAETPEPMATELRRVVLDYRSGRPLGDALREVQQRLNLESFTIFTSAVLVCLERGGRVTFALERISEGLQELQRLERKLEADSAAGRKLALFLGLFPIFFMVGFTLLDPVSMGYLYNTFIGQIILFVIGVMVFVAVKWCMHILDVDF